MLSSTLSVLLAIAAITCYAAPENAKGINEEPDDVAESLSSTTMLTTISLTTEETAEPPKSCPVPFDLIGDQCLYFATFAEVTQDEGRQMCHSVDGELVAVKTATQMETVINFIIDNGMDSKNFWVDGRDVGNEGEWIFSSGDPVPMGTPFWMATEFNSAPDGSSNQNCAEIIAEDGFLMNDVSCLEKRSPICEHSVLPMEKSSRESKKVPKVDCPPFFVDIKGICLAFITWAYEAWDVSRQTCHGLSGELASLNDIEQLRAIYEYLHLESISSHSFWLGGSDETVENFWVWINGGAIPRGTPWWGNSNTTKPLSEPDGGDAQNCLAMNSRGEHFFRDKACYLLFNPLCISEPLNNMENTHN